MAKRDSVRTIRELLDAGHGIVAENGIGRLTLDAVVRRAGLSKGAVLHHFKTKDDLTTRMMQDAVERFNADVSQERGDDRSPGSYTRAYIAVTLRIADQTDQDNAYPLIAELSRHEGARAVFTKAVEEWTAAGMNDGLGPVVAYFLRLTVDGLMMYETAGQPLDPEVRAGVVALMMGMTR